MNHKVIEILKTFSKNDIKSFKIFLHSPFFNNSKKLINLYDLLLKYSSDYELSDLKDEELSKMINPNIPYNKSTTKALFSDLYSCCLEYFKISNFLNKKIESSDFLRDELFKRKLFKEIERNIELTEDSLDVNSNINAEHFLNKFKLATDKANHFHICVSKSNAKLLNSDTENITERGKYLIYFFVTEIIREYDNLITISKTFSSLKQSNLILEMFSRINLFETLDLLILHEKNKALSAIFEIYKALLNSILFFEDERSYYNYIKYLIKNIGFLSINEKRFHFRGLMKNCILRRGLNGNSNNIDNELFKLYDYVLKNGYYKSSVSDFLSLDLYRNILLLALRLKKYKWVIRFIKMYSKKINPARRNNVYYYSLAEYYFKRKMYKYALENYHKISKDDFIIKIDMRNQMLIANYELNNFESVISMIDSYNQFLKQDNVLSQSQKKLYKNFVKMVQLLTLCKTSPNTSYINGIEMQMKKDLPFRDWISDKFTDIYTSNSNRYFIKEINKKFIYSGNVKAS